jgi:glutathione S-transferase
MNPILFSFRRCPYAIRARMSLSLANIAYEHREIDLKNKPKEMLRYSPKATVPVLILPNKVIDESYNIVKWALETSKMNTWTDGLLNPSTQLLLERLHQHFIPALNRYKYSTRYEMVNLNNELTTINQYLELLNTQLKEHGFISKSTASALDILIFPFIRQFTKAHSIGLDAYPLLLRWCHYWTTSQTFNETMSKYPLWDNLSKPIIVNSSTHTQ